MSRPPCTMRFDRIPTDAEALVLPLDTPRHTRLAGGVSRTGLGDHKRIQPASLARFPFFARPEDCGTHHARCTRIARLDLWLVSPHRDRRKCDLLLRDFCPARLSNRAAALPQKIASERRLQSQSGLSAPRHTTPHRGSPMQNAPLYADPSPGHEMHNQEDDAYNQQYVE